MNQKDIQDFLNEQLKHDAMKELQSMLNKEFAKPQNQRDYSRISEITDAYAMLSGKEEEIQKASERGMQFFKNEIVLLNTDNAHHYTDKSVSRIIPIISSAACLVLTLGFVHGIWSRQQKLEPLPPKVQTVETVSAVCTETNTQTALPAQNQLSPSTTQTTAAVTSVLPSESKNDLEVNRKDHDVLPQTSMLVQTTVSLTETEKVLQTVTALSKETKQISTTVQSVPMITRYVKDVGLSEQMAPLVTKTTEVTCIPAITTVLKESDSIQTMTESTITIDTTESISQFRLSDEGVIYACSAGDIPEVWTYQPELESCCSKERLKNVVIEHPEGLFSVQILCGTRDKERFYTLSIDEAHRLQEYGIPIAFDVWKPYLYAVMTAEQIENFPGADGVFYLLELSDVIVESSYLPEIGDVNYDGTINELDLELMNRLFSGKELMPLIQFYCCDYDRDGKIDESDYDALQNWIAANTKDLTESKVIIE